ncbi:MAG TPA: feruloyl-CoA synthase [Vicinamibacterales bacterium]|nr:feruloyl-CoA synthase [Vicinamibacterales bacterium]
MSSGAPARRVRPVHIADNVAEVRRLADGTIYMRSTESIEPYPVRLTDRLEYWASQAPDRVFLAQRPAPAPGQAPEDVSGWRTVTYRQALDQVRRLAQGLIDRKLSRDRTVVILSSNSIEHALLALAAMYVGVPYAPIAPAYSLQATEFGTLRQVFDRMKPGLVFAAEGAKFERALKDTLPAGAELVVSSSEPADLSFTSFAALQVAPSAAVDAARDRVNGDTIAKVLFTSGSTGKPKGVINTQRMLCSNQVMIRSHFRFLADEPPVLCCWLPWNHTAGGNHNFGIVLFNGGTLYIDEGKPTPQHFAMTLRNLREIPAVAHFTVPRTYEMLLPHLRRDPVLRDTFFKNLKIYFYAAAGLGQRFWDELRDLSFDAIGEELGFVTGFGATETAPFAICTAATGANAGWLGLPVPGLELKLTPVGTKLEARVKGPNVTPGYWGDDAITQAAFDEEGYYKTGDAMLFVDPADPGKGLIFDGRLAEDFKLSTGTWVSVGPLRARIVMQGRGLVQDVVIAGHDRDFASALVFPNVGRCREAAGLDNDAPAADVVAHPVVRQRFQETFDTLAAESTGSSTFVSRAVILDVPPSLDAKEITDKGSINQKAVLQHRAAVVDDLYSDTPSHRVLQTRKR